MIPYKVDKDLGKFDGGKTRAAAAFICFPNIH